MTVAGMEISFAPGITGIATEDAPEEARARMRSVEVIGDRYVLCAQAPMEMSGEQVDVQDGKLVALPRETLI